MELPERLVFNVPVLLLPDVGKPIAKLELVKLEKLGGRLPYLECHDGEDGLVHDTGRDEVEIRGIELTALMLLQAILPRDAHTCPHPAGVGDAHHFTDVPLYVIVSARTYNNF